MTTPSITLPTPHVALSKLTSSVALCPHQSVARVTPSSTTSHPPRTHAHMPASTAASPPNRMGAATHRRHLD
jgi:hypothetical protein